MPPIFKALASISTWVLFIFGWLCLILGNIEAIVAGALFDAQPPPVQFYLANGVGAAFFILLLCAMKLRQMLE